MSDYANGRTLNIYKPENWTSFDVVAKLRNILRIKKIGHAGTLDPFATGVLVVCTGKATKQINTFVDTKKEYVGTVEFGKTTDSFDVTGKITSESSTEELTLEKIQEILPEFRGEILQTPPMFSAKKIKGKRLYKLARKGIEVERPPVQITIFELEILEANLPFVTFKVVCSKGTYIRALADDIGKRLGCGAYLQKLVRTKVGDFRVEDSITIESLIEQVKDENSKESV
ncbi:MAG: tRNA pseudouridine(55) synthase TruB [Calditrichaeota bacterium]|nr:MAG: tRNA pseudouridine(55) synthase TruB [Calditrichota bacterium]